MTSLSPWGNCGWTAARQNLLELVRGFGVLSKNTLASSQEEGYTTEEEMHISQPITTTK